jgi:hypothetical protein
VSIADDFREAYKPRTATEIKLMVDVWREKHKVIGDAWLSPLTDKLMHIAFGRTVSAQRARFLRRRGEDVRRHGCTSTGRARYKWMRRNPVWIGLDMAPGSDTTVWS